MKTRSDKHVAISIRKTSGPHPFTTPGEEKLQQRKTFLSVFLRERSFILRLSAAAHVTLAQRGEEGAYKGGYGCAAYHTLPTPWPVASPWAPALA
ncbi:hypothetical protein HCH_03226 [Hahella chejuensis KCTC 2396]|uniref:Uncharacterized protein n=1 Tax=Hahella chejuensis (strain KCTC 2396) TaxID=349521 RepID=Q2SH88_HAHCH|nr:hypothetical protein HCH_03226 [Hahella chejuensis KCTC 2396]